VTLYDRIGTTYESTRSTDPRIAGRIWAALGQAQTVVNVGAGTGHYEPADRKVVAGEPSEVMTAARPPGSAPVVRAHAEALPFADGEFDAAMAVLSDHHWRDRAGGLRELRRIGRRVVVFSFDVVALSLRSFSVECVGNHAPGFPPRTSSQSVGCPPPAGPYLTTTALTLSELAPCVSRTQ